VVGYNEKLNFIREGSRWAEKTPAFLAPDFFVRNQGFCARKMRSIQREKGVS
jgi:hypothetical protein